MKKLYHGTISDFEEIDVESGKNYYRKNRNIELKNVRVLKRDSGYFL